MTGQQGSRKPIVLDQLRLPAHEELLPCLDGSEMSAIDVLVAVHGDIEIACERTGLSEAAFGRYLARCDAGKLAEGFKALQLIQVFTLAAKVGRSIMDQLDELKPGQLVAIYPKLVELIPVLSESKLRINASQTNNTTVNLGSGTQLPDDVRAAFERLGIQAPG